MIKDIAIFEVSPALETLTRAELELTVQTLQQQLAQKDIQLKREIAQRQRTENELQDKLKELSLAYKQAIVYAQELTGEITERRRAEAETEQHRESLQVSQDRFRQVISSISDHVYMTKQTADGHIFNLYISPNIETLTGYPAQKFIDDPCFWSANLAHPADQAIVADGWQLAPGQSGEIEYRLIRADGQIIWVRDSARAEAHANSIFVYGIVSDITQRKCTEEALRQHARQLELLHAVSTGLRQARTSQQIAHTLLTSVIAIIKANQATLYLASKDNLSPILQVADGGQIIEQPSSAADILLRQVLATGQPLFTQAGHGSSTAIIPLKGVDLITGVLHVVFNETCEFNALEQHLLTAMAEIAGNALQRSLMMETLEQRVSDRTRELAALYDMTVLASGVQELESMLKQSLGKILEAGQGDAVCIHLLKRNKTELHLVGQRGLPANSLMLSPVLRLDADLADWPVWWVNQPVIVPDLTAATAPSFIRVDGFRSYLGAPMRVKGRVLGMLSLFWVARRQLTLEQIVLLSTIADQMGVAVEIAHLRQRVAQTATVEERQRLARELHDSVTQSLYSQTLFARIAQDALEDGDAAKTGEVLAQLGQNALHALKEMRLLLYELRPSILEQEGLVQALNTRLEAVECRVGVAVQFEADAPELSKHLERELYFIAIEALNNALKHAAASEVHVQLTCTHQHLRLVVSDNGRGFEVDAQTGRGMGLKSMSDRAEQIDGRLIINSTPGQGTQVCILVNLAK